MNTAWHEELIVVHGLMAKARKTIELVDDGSGPYVHLIPGTVDYQLTVYGDAGEDVELPFDGRTIRWGRVSSSSWKSEYVALSMS